MEVCYGLQIKYLLWGVIVGLGLGIVLVEIWRRW